MQMIEQLNSANLIGLLAESLGIMTPNEQSLKAHLSDESDALVAHFKEACDLEPAIVEKLLEKT